MDYTLRGRGVERFAGISGPASLLRDSLQYQHFRLNVQKAISGLVKIFWSEEDFISDVVLIGTLICEPEHPVIVFLV